MVIGDLTLANIGSVVTNFIGAKSENTVVMCNEAIELDLAGVQLLIAYNKEKNVKVDVQLKQSSLELLIKTGFHVYIGGGRFVLQ
jgi:hypothetical protein